MFLDALCTEVPISVLLEIHRPVMKQGRETDTTASGLTACKPMPDYVTLCRAVRNDYICKEVIESAGL